MKKLLLLLTPILALCAGSTANAYEAKDFIGKVCGQSWLGNPLNTTAGLEGSYGVFEEDPSDPNNVILKGFRMCDQATFRVSDNTLTLLKSNEQFTASSADGTQYDIFTTQYDTGRSWVNGYGYVTFYNFYGPIEDSPWEGTISEFPSGNCLKVTFNTGVGLAFMDELSFSMIHDISEKTFFYVYDANGTQYMNTNKGVKTLPVRVTLQNETSEKKIYGIQNFAGFGWTFRNEEEELTVTFVNYGILATVDNNNKVTITDQPVAGITKTTGWTKNSGGGFWCAAKVTYTGNKKIRKTSSGGSIEGTYTELGTQISGENMWHPDHDGDFKISEDARIDLENDWVVEKVIDNGAGTDFTVSESNIVFGKDVTPNVKLTINTYGFDSARGMFMTCTLSDYKNAEQVESYEIYAVPNHFSSINDSGFTTDPYKGHANAVCLEDYACSSTNPDRLAFYIPIEDFKDYGWDKNNNKFTFFVKFNLKPLARSTSSAFGAMATSLSGTPTSIDDITSNNALTVKAGNGEIAVSGAQHVEVYTLSGVCIYSGAEGNVAVAPGIYVVKADGAVRKVTVK